MPILLSVLSLLFPWALASVVVAGAEDVHTNRLAQESSPYLRLHAHNPVDWYPWGDEALERARREERLIFLSVGYSTCYWCHVMEREVFSDPEIAAVMNEWFVNIKVDREERPDLDEIYMTATQLLTGSGGWPNSVFLTPDLEPFFAGTYFPPRDRPGRRGFPFVLETIHQAWSERPDQVRAQAKAVATAVKRVLTPAREGAEPAPNLVETVVAALKTDFDDEWGGFGKDRKFPSPSSLWLLFERGGSGDEEARKMVLDTLRSMGRGAIFDQLDGGFHRYTLDAAWRIPHFEKMLYDNAHLAELLSLAYERTGDPEFERLARRTFDFVLRQMLLPNGAFASAIDAETDGVEGAFYLWTRSEIQELLSSGDFDLLAPILGLDDEPNVGSHHYTMYLTDSWTNHARRTGISRKELLARVEPSLARLRAARSRREFPLVDDKVLTDWNGMMVAALARGGSVLGEDRYLSAASRAARFLLSLRDSDGLLLHTWREGKGRIPALLDDYAFLVRGLLALERATGERHWLDEAEQLAAELEARLAAPGGGFFTSGKGPYLLVQASSASDGAVPSANGVAALNLLELAKRTGKQAYRVRAESTLRSFSSQVEQQPRAMPTVALGILRAGSGVATGLSRQVVRLSARTVGGSGSDWTRFELLLEISEGWHINANPASADFLIPTRVVGDVRSVTYPEAEPFRPDFTDEEIAVYSNQAVITGELKTSGDGVSVTYQACDERRCLPPVKVAVAVAKED